MESARPVWRPRVVERIQRALRQRVAILAAPAGFGKTVALDQAAARLDEPVLTVHLSARSDVARAARTFADAIARVPGTDPKLVASLRERGPDAAAIAAALDAVAPIVALDGLGRDALRDADLRALIDAVVSESASRWIVATRAAAALPIASWMAYGTCGAPVSAAELAFTEEEARDVARAAGENDLERVGGALAWTHGWPTAFVLALRDPSTSPGRGVVAEYLAEQVVDPLDEGDRELLVQLAPLPVIDLDDGAALGPFAADVVAGAMQRLAPLVEQVGESAYRCHPLVRAFALSRLRKRPHGEYAAAAQRAAQALLAAARYAEALEVFTDAGDLPAIEDLVVRHGRELLERGATRELTAAIRAMAERGQGDTPAILALRATLASFEGDSRAAVALSERAIAAAADPAEKLQLVHGFALELVKRNDPYSREALGRVAPLLGAACGRLEAERRPGWRSWARWRWYARSWATPRALMPRSRRSSPLPKRRTTGACGRRRITRPATSPTSTGTPSAVRATRRSPHGSRPKPVSTRSPRAATASSTPSRWSCTTRTTAR